MATHEYKVVPAPRQPERLKGVRSQQDRFALTVEALLNKVAAEGWQFVRSETLPCQPRGWFSRKSEDQVLLVFRREREATAATATPAAAWPPTEPRLAADRSMHRRPSHSSLAVGPPDGKVE